MKQAIYACLAVTCLLSLPALAQQSAVQTDLRSQLQATRDILDKERRIVLAGEMNLTKAERDQFWNLFNEYADDLRVVNDIRVDVILRYSENYRQMTDQVAKDLVNDRFKHERELLKLRERYLKRFRKILPETKVARFFQVESKLDAALDYNLASNIPVIQDAPGQR